jgi:hypothetical protein
MPRLRRWIFREAADGLLWDERRRKGGGEWCGRIERQPSRVVKSRFFAALRMTASAGKGRGSIYAEQEPKTWAEIDAKSICTLAGASGLKPITAVEELSRLEP